MESIWWLFLFVILLAIEIITMGLATIWFAIGALAAFIASLCQAPLEIQLAIFVIVSCIMLFFTRPFIKGRLSSKTIRTNADNLVGQNAIVTISIDNLQARGAASINGLEWTARSSDPEVKIEQGETVRIKEISGVKLIVEPVRKEKNLSQA